MNSLTSPILVLDSGLGGLTVVRALRVLPAEDIVYFGDTARLPYGSKTAATVFGFVRQIIQYLRPLQPKHVVIACNTATALALPAARAAFPDLSIGGVIEPGAAAAIMAAGAKPKPVIAVLATEATVRSKAYERAILRRRNHARIVLKPAPLLVPIIEEGRSYNDPLVLLALEQYLAPLKKYAPDVLVLGCTHYPVLKDHILRVMGPQVQVIDSAAQCAHDTARRLTASGVVAAALSFGERESGAGNGLRGSLRCIVTDDPHRFEKLAPRFLGEKIDTPELVSTDFLHGSMAPFDPISELRPAI